MILDEMLSRGLRFLHVRHMPKWMPFSTQSTLASVSSTAENPDFASSQKIAAKYATAAYKCRVDGSAPKQLAQEIVSGLSYYSMYLGTLQLSRAIALANAHNMHDEAAAFAALAVTRLKSNRDGLTRKQKLQILDQISLLRPHDTPEDSPLADTKFAATSLEAQLMGMPIPIFTHDNRLFVHEPDGTGHFGVVRRETVSTR